MGRIAVTFLVVVLFIGAVVLPLLANMGGAPGLDRIERALQERSNGSIAAGVLGVPLFGWGAWLVARSGDVPVASLILLPAIASLLIVLPYALSRILVKAACFYAA